MSLQFPLARVQAILQRFARPQDVLECQARARLAVLTAQEADPLWEELCLRVLLNPVYLACLWPELCAERPELLKLMRGLQEQLWVPALSAQAEQTCAQWVLEQGDAEQADTLMQRLLEYLEQFQPERESSFVCLARYYSWRDLLVTQLVAPQRIALVDQVFALLDMQARQWGRPYCAGYAYQGYERLGLAGAKPTEQRLAAYGFLDWLQPSMQVLEIGCNNGFMAIELARRVARVDALEYNPYLVEIGRLCAAELGQHNVQLQVADFASWRPARRYDLVLSFANHCTIDGNLALEFECYVAKLWQLTEEGGHLLFESHNVFAPGKGAPGDDGDLERKFEVMERYFELLDSKMTPAFVPHHDVDKLFVVLRRRPQVLERVTPQLRLAEARQRYSFVGRPFG